MHQKILENIIGNVTIISHNNWHLLLYITVKQLPSVLRRFELQMRHIFKPEPNVLKLLHIISSSNFPKITHYFYFVFISLPIIPLLFFMFCCFSYWHPEKHGLYIYFCCSYVLCNISDVHCIYISKIWWSMKSIPIFP